MLTPTPNRRRKESVQDRLAITILLAAVGLIFFGRAGCVEKKQKPNLQPQTIQQEQTATSTTTTSFFRPQQEKEK